MSLKRFSGIDRLPDFEKDLKKLQRKFRTLPEDLDVFLRTALVAFHFLKARNQEIYPIPGLRIGTPTIYKAKKFACKSLKGSHSRSGIRVIYAYHEQQNRIELIEIYYKGDKSRENRRRICKLYK